MFAALVILTIGFGILAVGGVIADHVFPRIKFLERWFDELEKCKYSKR